MKGIHSLVRSRLIEVGMEVTISYNKVFLPYRLLKIKWLLLDCRRGPQASAPTPRFHITELMFGTICWHLLFPSH